MGHNDQDGKLGYRHIRQIPPDIVAVIYTSDPADGDYQPHR